MFRKKSLIPLWRFEGIAHNVLISSHRPRKRPLVSLIFPFLWHRNTAGDEKHQARQKLCIKTFPQTASMTAQVRGVGDGVRHSGRKHISRKCYPDGYAITSEEPCGSVKSAAYGPMSTMGPSPFGTPPSFSTLRANLEASVIAVTGLKSTLAKPSAFTRTMPASTGAGLFGSTTQSW